MSYQFAILIKVGLALFCLKAIGCIIHVIKPHKKAGGAKAAILSICFLAWFIALNILIYSPSGRNCSSENIPDYAYTLYWAALNVTGLFLWRTALALYIMGGLGILCLCALCVCMAKRR